MSNRVLRTVLNKGSKTILLHVYLESDGVEGELVSYPLVDSTVYDPVLDTFAQSNVKLTVKQIWHSFSWFDALLSFDNTTPTPSWVLTRDAHNHIDFRHFGGIADRLIDPNTNVSTDRTGKILLTTNGFAPAGSVGTLILELSKAKD
jgi:hypothetical protein